MPPSRGMNSQLLIDMLKHDAFSWVCPGGRAGEALKNLYKPWGRLCRAAGVAGVRPHDLRHGYVSIGALGGESLVVIGAIVGHSAAGMTERYAHLSDDRVRVAADRISSVIAAAMSGVDPAPDPTYPGRTLAAVPVAAGADSRGTPARRKATLDRNSAAR